jgi:hypothetical protein
MIQRTEGLNQAILEINHHIQQVKNVFICLNIFHVLIFTLCGVSLIMYGENKPKYFCPVRKLLNQIKILKEKYGVIR